jgi:hypothetical protein
MGLGLFPRLVYVEEWDAGIRNESWWYRETLFRLSGINVGMAWGLLEVDPVVSFAVCALEGKRRNIWFV